MSWSRPFMDADSQFSRSKFAPGYWRLNESLDVAFFGFAGGGDGGHFGLRRLVAFLLHGGGALGTDKACFGQVPHDQLDRADAVVVAGNRQIDEIGIAVGID